MFSGIILQGAVVTNDCLFNNDYPYALDIYWSCGSEQFDRPLRLHTFKRHSHSHQQVFADQFVTYNENGTGQLWFNAYSTPICVRVDYGVGDLRLSTSGDDCSQFTLLPTSNTSRSNNNTAPDGSFFYLQDVSTGGCAGLGGDDASCDSHQSTGGSECGSVDHRYLPLQILDDCTAEEAVLTFYFATRVEDCSNGNSEWPENECF